MWHLGRKVVRVLGNHSLAQIRNAASYSWHAWRRFPSARVPYSPLWLDLLITARCNLNCSHCSFRITRSRRAARGFPDMDMDTFVRILDRFPSAMSIVLAGGEPLLHPAVFEMIDRAHARRLKVHIPTNGTLLPRHLASLLEAPVEMLNVSLYGADREEFAGLTGGRGTLFDETVEAMREIARRRPGRYPRILRASYICTKANLSRVAGFIRLCEQIGVDQVKLKNLNPTWASGCEESLSLREDDPDVQRFMEDLRLLPCRIPVFPPRLYRPEYKPRGCRMPFRLLTIDGDGSIGRCCVEGTDPSFGNCFTDADVWNGPVLTAARRDLSDHAAPLPPLCLHCEEMIHDYRSIGGRRK